MPQGTIVNSHGAQVEDPPVVLADPWKAGVRTHPFSVWSPVGAIDPAASDAPMGLKNKQQRGIGASDPHGLSPVARAQLPLRGRDRFGPWLEGFEWPALRRAFTQSLRHSGTQSLRHFR